MKVLIDNGHGAETLGKQSPDGKLKEWKYTREIARAVVTNLIGKGYDAALLVEEDYDVPLAERVRRVNATCEQEGKENVCVVSVHSNAAGDGREWNMARGWQVHVVRSCSPLSANLARALIGAATSNGLTVRKWSSKYPYWPQNLAICRDTVCPAVLTENLFMDNKEDIDLLLSEEGRQKIIDTHVTGIVDYIRKIK